MTVNEFLTWYQTANSLNVYDPQRKYKKGDMCIYSDKIYLWSEDAINHGGPNSYPGWREVTMGDLLK